MAMHDLPGVVGTGVDVVGTEKNKRKVMQFRERFLISLFPSLQVFILAMRKDLRHLHVTFRKVLVFLTLKDLRLKVIRNIDQKKALLLHTTAINV